MSELQLENRLIGVSVLVVEDSPEGGALVKRYLQSAGATVEIAESGQDGIKKALEHSYDVILTDIQMPDLNGYELASLLRQKKYSRPIIAITGHVTKGERTRCLRAGCDDQLTKPVDPSTLIEVIACNSTKFIDPNTKPSILTLH